MKQCLQNLREEWHQQDSRLRNYRPSFPYSHLVNNSISARIPLWKLHGRVFTEVFCKRYSTQANVKQKSNSKERCRKVHGILYTVLGIMGHNWEDHPLPHIRTSYVGTKECTMYSMFYLVWGCLETTFCLIWLWVLVGSESEYGMEYKQKRAAH